MKSTSHIGIVMYCLSALPASADSRTLHLRCFRLIAAWALFLGAGAASSQADFRADDANFCAHAQVLIADTDVVPGNIVHDSYEAFVESKVMAHPLQTQQFYSNPLTENADIFKVVSCKMRTADSIADAYAAAGQNVQASDDRSCEFLTTHILDKVADTLEPGELRLARDNILVDEEEITFIGPMWLDPWPFQPAYTDAAGSLHLKSRALYVPWSMFIPAPAAFKGVYYCHLPSPAYIEALLLGQVSAQSEH